MSALILPTVTPDTTPEDLREALCHLSAEAGRMLSRDNLGRMNPQWARWHGAINDLLDELVGR